MTSLKSWKTNWELKTLTHDELFTLVKKVLLTQLDDLNENDILLTSNLLTDYDADSVDIVAMLLNFEELFKSSAQATQTVIPTDKLGQIILVEDLFDVIYQVLVEIEKKLEANNLPLTTLKI